MRWKVALSHETISVSQYSEINMSSVAFISACSSVSPSVSPLLREGKWIYVRDSEAADWISESVKWSLFPTSSCPSHCLCVAVWMSDKLQHKPSICAVGCVCFTPPLPPCWCDRASKQHPVVCPQRGSRLPLHIHPNCLPFRAIVLGSRQTGETHWKSRHGASHRR